MPSVVSYHVPVEVIDEIFSLLKGNDLVVCSSASQILNIIVERRIYRDIYLVASQSRTRATVGLFESLDVAPSGRSPARRNFVINLSVALSSTTPPFDFTIPTLMSFPRLHSLRLMRLHNDNPYWSQVDQSIDRFCEGLLRSPSLRELSIMHYNSIELETLSLAKHLMLLCIIDTWIMFDDYPPPDFYIPSWTSLSTLVVEGCVICPVLQSHLFTLSIPKIPTLREIDFAILGPVDLNALQVLINICGSSVKSLVVEVQAWPLDKEEEFTLDLRELTNLKHIGIVFNRFKMKRHLGALLGTIPTPSKLKTFVVQLRKEFGMKAKRWQGVDDLLATMPKLREIQIQLVILGTYLEGKTGWKKIDTFFASVFPRTFKAGLFTFVLRTAKPGGVGVVH